MAASTADPYCPCCDYSKPDAPTCLGRGLFSKMSSTIAMAVVAQREEPEMSECERQVRDDVDDDRTFLCPLPTPQHFDEFIQCTALTALVSDPEGLSGQGHMFQYSLQRKLTAATMQGKIQVVTVLKGRWNITCQLPNVERSFNRGVFLVKDGRDGATHITKTLPPKGMHKGQSTAGCKYYRGSTTLTSSSFTPGSWARLFSIPRDL
ncbi:hypothetical protein T440DRAFT_514155 [Plenodomus tracheiphilus IPT5]|uniref:Uncharacterized protein n=1 Tax=Plenodomus tracheiphilus IPT5 TaxID=1408161 RepID=A0A6A7BI35_9PLEO|nr:hypothetical protein T440DRAFT_514155 [Plenodomus tracheiphilus IPT5]